MLVDTLLDDMVRISHTMLSTYQLEKMLSRVASSMRYHLGCRHCGLLLVNDHTGCLEVKISRGVSATFQRNFRTKKYTLDDELFRRAADSDQLLRVKPGDDTSALDFKNGYEVMLLGCIKTGQEIAGFAFAQTENPEGFSHDNEAYFAVLINLVSLSLEMTTLRERLKEVEMYDRLTGLLNYNGFQVIAERSFHSLRDCGEKVGVMVMDIDNFKPYRGTYGIAESETVLKETAVLIKEIAGENAVIGRYGLDEFIVWLEHRDEAMVRELAESIMESVRTHAYPQSKPRLTVSVGAAICPPESDVDFIELVGCAKELLYGAKRSENTVHISEVVS